jgi:hypothetical protein
MDTYKISSATHSWLLWSHSNLNEFHDSHESTFSLWKCKKNTCEHSCGTLKCSYMTFQATLDEMKNTVWPLSFTLSRSSSVGSDFSRGNLSHSLRKKQKKKIRYKQMLNICKSTRMRSGWGGHYMHIGQALQNLIHNSSIISTRRSPGGRKNARLPWSKPKFKISSKKENDAWESLN